MPAQHYGYSTTSITWDQSETEVNQDSVDFVTITCVGHLKADGATLSGALLLVPDTIPINADGPVKSATELAGAALDTRVVSFGGDGRIEIRCTYKKSLSEILGGGGGSAGDVSDADRFNGRVELEEAPLLVHPVVGKFPQAERSKLACLMKEIVIPNPNHDPDGGNDKEFIYAEDYDGVVKDTECSIDDTDYTVGGITASPLDYARLIRAGVETYWRPTVRFVWRSSRDERPDNTELNEVGDVVDPAPSETPTASDDKDWIFWGAIWDHEAEGAYDIEREYQLSARGGAFSQIYKGGSADISEVIT